MLNSFSCRVGLNDDWGNLTLTILDPNSVLTNSSSDQSCKIKENYTIQLYLGKDSSTVQRWFYGIIIQTVVTRGKGGFQAIQIQCVGYGSRLAQRYTNYKRYQQKKSDRTTLDESDFRAWASNIVNELMTTTGHLPLSSLGLDPKITANNIQFNSTPISDFQENLQTFAGAISKMAGNIGCVYGVDADLDFFFRKPQTKDSGFLFSNKTSSNELQNWDKSSLGVIMNDSPLTFTNDVIKNGYSVLHAYGSSSDSIDINQTTVNASFNLSANYIAIPFVPAQNNITKIGIYARRRGDLTDDLTVRIIGSNASNAPVSADLQKKVLVSVDKLNQLPTVYDSWIEFPFEVWHKKQ